MKLKLALIFLSTFVLVGTRGVAEGDERYAEPGLVGKWVFQFLNQAREDLHILDANHLKQKSVLGGFLYLDIEGTYELDTTTVPKRWVVTVTKTDPNQVVKMDVGSHAYCVYRLGKDSLDLNCDQEKFPSEFAEGLSYARVKEYERFLHSIQ